MAECREPVGLVLSGPGRVDASEREVEVGVLEGPVSGFAYQSCNRYVPTVRRVLGLANAQNGGSLTSHHSSLAL